MRHPYLNLIPETQKKLLKRERTFFLVHNVIGLLVVVLALNGILLTAARFVLVKHARELKSDTSLVSVQHSKLQSEIKRVNNQLQDASRIQERFTKWSALFSDAASALPAGATIDFLNINAGSKTFRITGKAADRASLIAAREALRSLPAVATLESPLSNFIEKENITFRFTGTLTEGSYRRTPAAD